MGMLSLSLLGPFALEQLVNLSAEKPNYSKKKKKKKEKRLASSFFGIITWRASHESEAHLCDLQKGSLKRREGFAFA